VKAETNPLKAPITGEKSVTSKLPGRNSDGNQRHSEEIHGVGCRTLHMGQCQVIATVRRRRVKRRYES